MFRSVSRAAVIVLALAALVLTFALTLAQQPPGTPPVENAPADEPREVHVDDAETTSARETLADLLASEEIDRIDFEAETYEQGMEHIYLAVDTILELNEAAAANPTLLADHASQVIQALDTHSPRGLMTTFGKNVKRLPVRNPGEARMLGELIGQTVALIREQLGQSEVSYRDHATRLFHSVLLDVEEGPFLVQYVEGIQRIAEQPAANRARYFR